MKEDDANKNLSWLTVKNIRDIVVIVFIVTITYKLFSLNIDLNIKEFSLTDLISILVSFFAIGLSIAFYFKATDTSNRFYDNSYAFTKDVSEILGRMEAGFGERLRHLDEGYSGIRDRFDKFPFDSIKAREEIEKENQEIVNKEEELRKTIEDLAQKAHLAENEKTELFEHMERLNRELEQSRREARRLERQIRINEKDNIANEPKVLQYLARHMRRFQNRTSSGLVHRGDYRDAYAKVREELPRDAIIDLESNGFLDENGNLTDEAIFLIRNIQRKMSI